MVSTLGLPGDAVVGMVGVVVLVVDVAAASGRLVPQEEGGCPRHLADTGVSQGQASPVWPWQGLEG